jgi:hypothetical protein
MRGGGFFIYLALGDCVRSFWKVQRWGSFEELKTRLSLTLSCRHLFLYTA